MDQLRAGLHRALWLLGLILLSANVVLQLLDGATSFVALQRGFIEINPYTLWIMGVVGNGYLGVGVEKLAFVGLFAVIWFIATTLRDVGNGTTSVLGLGAIDIILVFFALSFVQVVLSNLIVIGQGAA